MSVARDGVVLRPGWRERIERLEARAARWRWSDAEKRRRERIYREWVHAEQAETEWARQRWADAQREGSGDEE